MAQFAPVAPIQVLEEMRKQNVLGTYHLLLAHHVREHPERFRELFYGYDRSTIIMDNSLVELGTSNTDALVLEAVQAIQQSPSDPHWIIPVLTDVMGDGPATREAATRSYEWWNTNAPTWPLMVVLQGNDWEDFCKTADYFLADRNNKFPNIRYVGIPRILTGSIGSRQTAIAYVDAIAPDISVHLLGFSDDVVDDVISSNMSSVEGIDSAVPLRYAYSVGKDGDLNESLLYYPTAEIPPRPAEWFDEGFFSDADYTNLYNVRKWVA